MLKPNLLQLLAMFTLLLVFFEGRLGVHLSEKLATLVVDVTNVGRDGRKKTKEC